MSKMCIWWDVSDGVIAAEWPDGNSDLTECPLVSGATFSAQSTLHQECRTVCVFKILGVRIITITKSYPFLKSKTELRSLQLLFTNDRMILPPHPHSPHICRGFFGNACKLAELFNTFSCLIAQLITDVNNQQMWALQMELITKHKQKSIILCDKLKTYKPECKQHLKYWKSISDAFQLI